MQPTNGIPESNRGENARESVIQNGSASENSKKVNAKVVAKVKKARSFLELTLERNAVDSLRRNNRKVLVVYTGGTIGMMKNSQGGKLSLFLSSSLRIKTEKSTWSQKC